MTAAIWTRFGVAPALALALAAACGSDKTDVARTTLDRAIEPAGEQPNVFDNALHAAHLSGTTPLSCSECHDTAASGFETPSQKRCAACHSKNQVALHGEAVQCSQCHAFGAGTKTDASDCQSCHAQAQGDHAAITIHARIDCENCHVPHGDEPLATKSCLACHEDHQQNHGKPELSVIERCSQCHPPHTRSIEAVALCRDCHKDKLVRAVFRGHDKCETCHGDDRRSAPGAAPREPTECKTCHGGRVTLGATRVTAHQKCESCHAPHDPRGTAVQSCRRCHSGVVPGHPADPKAGACLGCHTAHPRSPETIVSACSKCHREARNDSSLHAPQRTRCSQCHGAHDFEPAGCGTCHQTQARLTATASGHKKCESCHLTPHAPRASPATCGKCHVSEYGTAPTGHRKCASCHEPHGGKRLPNARCVACHPERPDMTHGRIDGGCENCHRAHGPGGRAKPPACITCHARKRLPALHAVDDHKTCATCHRGHGMRELTRQTCLSGGCHPEQIDHEPVARICVGCHPFGASR